MKRNILLSIIAILIGLCVTVSTASATFIDWKFNPNGTGFATADTIHEYLDINGQADILNNYTTFTFHETGSFVSALYDSAHLLTPSISADFVGDGNLTATNFTFTSATLDVYDSSSALIGSFSLVNGGGALDNNYAPNGVISINFVADSLAAGYWFSPTGQDLSAWTVANSSPILTLGVATTNANTLQDPPPTYDNLGRPLTFTVSDNGQFKVSAVPEPGTLILLGLGFIGIAGVSRKKFKKN
jgi:hypothetical protein